MKLPQIAAYMIKLIVYIVINTTCTWFLAGLVKIWVINRTKSIYFPTKKLSSVKNDLQFLLDVHKHIAGCYIKIQLSVHEKSQNKTLIFKLVTITWKLPCCLGWFNSYITLWPIDIIKLGCKQTWLASLIWERSS